MVFFLSLSAHASLPGQADLLSSINSWHKQLIQDSREDLKQKFLSELLEIQGHAAKAQSLSQLNIVKARFAVWQRTIRGEISQPQLNEDSATQIVARIKQNVAVRTSDAVFDGSAPRAAVAAPVNFYAKGRIGPAAFSPPAAQRPKVKLWRTVGKGQLRELLYIYEELCQDWATTEAIHNQSKRFGIDPAWTFAVVKAESRCNPTDVSRKGAVGLMQVMPATALDMVTNLGWKDKKDEPYTMQSIIKVLQEPNHNVYLGLLYLRDQFTKFAGVALSELRLLPSATSGIELAIAAYNAGPGRVLQYKGIPPIQETQDYVPKVISACRAFFSAMAL